MESIKTKDLINKYNNNSKSFIEILLEEKINENLEEYVLDFVDIWHENIDDKRSLQEAIGFNENEYKKWVEDPKEIFYILHCRKFKNWVNKKIRK